MKTNENEALVVFSGGQDSTTCLFWAKKEFGKVHALTFRYGQKHVLEVERDLPQRPEWTSTSWMCLW